MASSPCILVCVMDDDLGLCLGCGRTKVEITQWGNMSETDRLALMQDLPKRLDAASGDTNAGL